MRKATQEQGSDVDVDLQRAMEQVSIISQALCDIQRRYQEQVRLAQRGGVKQRYHADFAPPGQQGKPRQSGAEASGVLSEVQRLKEQLERSEGQRREAERQLGEASAAVAQLQRVGTSTTQACPTTGAFRSAPVHQIIMTFSTDLRGVP